MVNEKTDIYYLKKMLKCIGRIKQTVASLTYDDFLNDEDAQDITMFNLIQISENAKRLSKDFTDRHSDIPWNDIYGLRNRIVHDYGNVVMDTIYYTLVNDIPDLKEEIEKEI